MAGRRDRVFLAQSTYRRRRLIDAVRMVPVIGLLFFLLPILGSGGETRATSSGGIYLFSVWLVLIVVSAVLTRLLSRGTQGVGSDPREPGGGEPL
ncbi:hypothetical protein [Maritimibacter fusiformis]|uniref:Uncharacterized protein n=1 Tax=Maritimibacter fusiformis TaxID=2603819 RepID=A0A5D0RPC1_9RHOB|nr:hypothetical protein [Maritimibacter fusiformis]TYB82498.1 hypothetical protein FVF75_07225 [Maritimibacter fusiformis]